MTEIEDGVTGRGGDGVTGRLGDGVSGWRNYRVPDKQIYGYWIHDPGPNFLCVLGLPRHSSAQAERRRAALREEKIRQIEFLDPESSIKDPVSNTIFP